MQLAQMSAFQIGTSRSLGQGGPPGGYGEGMTSGWDIAHQYKTQAQKDKEIAELGRLVDLASKQAEALKVQAETAERAQRSAWWFSASTLLVALGSLAVAILTLTVR